LGFRCARGICRLAGVHGGLQAGLAFTRHGSASSDHESPPGSSHGTALGLPPLVRRDSTPSMHTPAASDPDLTDDPPSVFQLSLGANRQSGAENSSASSSDSGTDRSLDSLSDASEDDDAIDTTLVRAAGAWWSVRLACARLNATLVIRTCCPSLPSRTTQVATQERGQSEPTYSADENGPPECNVRSKKGTQRAGPTANAGSGAGTSAKTTRRMAAQAAAAEKRKSTATGSKDSSQGDKRHRR
jgi:hypothetical protein